MNEDEKHVFHGLVALVIALAFVSILDHAAAINREAARAGPMQYSASTTGAELYQQPVGP